MKKSSRIQTVARVARIEEENAIVQFSKTQRIIEEREHKLRELEEYYIEYKYRMDEMGGSGTDINKLNEYRKFVRQIGEAVKIQKQLVAEARGELEKDSASWKAARVHHKVINKYQQRCKGEENMQQLRREQKESDEKAMHVKPQY